MIVVQQLSMEYAVEEHRITVLEGIDLEIDRGTSVAILGPSGSGKTTLLLLLAGLERPAHGTIAIGGTDLSTLDADGLADLRRDCIGIVFQSFHLIPSLTARGNVSLPLEMAGAPDAGESAGRMLHRVGLGERSGHYPAQLSGGEQQRVAIARALVHKPSLLLADEPTGNLDNRTGHRISELLFDLHDECGSTLVLVTHDEQLARRCDRQLRLEDGRLTDRGAGAVFN